MQSFGYFSKLFSQISQAFSSVSYKTQSLELLDINQMSEEEFIKKMQSLSSEISILKTILQYKNLFTLHPLRKMITSLIFLEQNQIVQQSPNEIGVVANAKVFVDIKFNQYIEIFSEEEFAIKTMKKINLNMLEFYVQECVNQYNLLQINKDYILNFKEKNIVYLITYKTTKQPHKFMNIFITYQLTCQSYYIKPQNILFIKGQGWKLADFGESIKYDNCVGLYTIKGTTAFLPQEIIKQIHKNKEVYQNLYQNDIYAVVCTLVMIRNPQYKSKDLLNHMDTQNLDLDLQNLLQTFKCDNPLEKLIKLKVLQQKINIEIFKPNLKVFDHSLILTTEQKLLIYYQQIRFIENDFINILDSFLQKCKNEKLTHEYQKLSLYLTLLFPFQIHQLTNFDQKLFNHQQIIKQKVFYLDQILFEYIYMFTFSFQDKFVYKYLTHQFIKKDIFLIIKSINDFIQIGDIQYAKLFLEKLGKQILQMNFDSYLLYLYNYFHQKLHGKSLSFDENYFSEYQLDSQQQENTQKEKNQFDLEYYLIQDKFLNKDTLNLEKLFQPLSFKFVLKEQTLNIVFSHVIQTLGFSEPTIAEDKLRLANFIKHQLIKGGFNRYKLQLSSIATGIVKLFLKYDLFEGLLDILNYFIYFTKFINKLVYHQTATLMQNLIFHLNTPKYHIQIEDEFNTKIKFKSIFYLYQQKIFILQNLNKLQYNMIQDQQKTEQQQINLDNLQNLYKVFNEIIANNPLILFIDQELLLVIQQFAQVLSCIEFQNEKYLRILILLLCKSIQVKIPEQFQMKIEIIQYKFEPILLQYSINCKQYNRVNDLFNQKKIIKEHELIIQQELLDSLSDLLLTKYVRLNRINSQYVLLLIARFSLNQTYQQFFNFKQHLYKEYEYYLKYIHISLLSYRLFFCLFFSQVYCFSSYYKNLVIDCFKFHLLSLIQLILNKKDLQPIQQQLVDNLAEVLFINILNICFYILEQLYILQEKISYLYLEYPCKSNFLIYLH